MKIIPIKTCRVTSGSHSLTKLIETYVDNIEEGSILAITSKVVSLCERRTIPFGKAEKETLVQQYSHLYTQNTNAYGFHFTITRNTLIPAAGIDESNSGGNYVLWPDDPQKTANEIREFLIRKFSVEKCGVILTDSTCSPLRRGTSGICLAYSGFDALNDYIGEQDLFGRPFAVSQANIASGLASSAVLVMGEGREQTPICLLSDLPFVNFQQRNPNLKELKNQYIALEKDIFAPFLTAVKWERGAANGES